MTRESIFLLLAAAGLVPVALSYGLMPQESMSYLYDIDASSVNSHHIFRAVMGLYFAQVIFWIAGARKPSLTLPALWTLAIFMLGLAAGRALSIVVDGMPHPLLLAYLVLEIGFGSVSLYLATKFQTR
ncbi:MAG: DUF4345 domain-containing protein [Halioglobus sp.]